MKLFNKFIAFIAIILLAFSIKGSAQSKPFIYADTAKAIGSSLYQKDTVIKSVSLKIYEGSKGGRYYIQRNKKGELARVYLKRNY